MTSGFHAQLLNQDCLSCGSWTAVVLVVFWFFSQLFATQKSRVREIPPSTVFLDTLLLYDLLYVFSLFACFPEPRLLSFSSLQSISAVILLLFHCASVTEAASPCFYLTDKSGSPQAPNLLCSFLILGMKSFHMRGRELDELYVVVMMTNRICLFKALSLIVYKFSTSKPQTTTPPPKKKNQIVAAQFQHRFLDAFKTNSKLSFINCVVHGICRLGV